MSKREPREVQTTQRVTALTKNQGFYLKAVETSTITICTGPAGSGKTWMACGIGARHLVDNRIQKIVLARPLVLCGRQDFGAFPGELNEKVSPYMRPLLDAFEDFFLPNDLKRMISTGVIEMMPLELLRGSSLKNSYIICDEAQNATYQQLHMLLTRIGEGSRMVLTGDESQTDLPGRGKNPLSEVIGRFRHETHPHIMMVRLSREDIVRHELIQWIDERLSNG